MSRVAASLHPAFHRRDGTLWVEEVSVAALAAAYGGPLYVYSAAALSANARRFRAALDPMGIEICYAVKANGALALLERVRAEGLGADIVSSGELRRALGAGIAPADVVFSGVGKTDEEMEEALAAGVQRFNIESAEELEALSSVARRAPRPARVAIRINPDIAAGGHAKISTGKKGDKFGVSPDTARLLWDRMAGMEGVSPRGLAVHIGSQIHDAELFSAAFERLAALAESLENPKPVDIDLGGGFGVDYGGQGWIDLDAYAAVVRRWFGDGRYALTVEPGRALVADAGALICRVTRWKREGADRFLILDAAMNDLIRPALYDARHELIAVDSAETAAETAHIVGPVCESADIFERDAPVPAVGAGDLVAFGGAGAYAAVMASAYNARALPAECLVAGDRHALIRPRFDATRMLALEKEADWRHLSRSS